MPEADGDAPASQLKHKRQALSWLKLKQKPADRFRPLVHWTT